MEWVELPPTGNSKKKCVNCVLGYLLLKLLVYGVKIIKAGSTTKLIILKQTFQC
jgi:hypothetical protein